MYKQTDRANVTFCKRWKRLQCRASSHVLDLSFDETQHHCLWISSSDIAILTKKLLRCYKVMKAQLSLNLINSQLRKCQTKKYRTTFRLFCVSTMYRHHFDLVEHQTSVTQLVCMTFTATLLHISVAYKVCLCEVRSGKTKQRMKIISNQKTGKSHPQYICFKRKIFYYTNFYHTSKI